MFGNADSNKRIHEYFLQTSAGTDPGFKVGTTEPWCSAFVNWCMNQVGIKGTHNAAAKSWVTWGVGPDQPRHGCVMSVTWAKGGHHVTFFDKTIGDRLAYFGGNQGGSHAITEGHATRKAFAAIAYRWPAGQ